MIVTRVLTIDITRKLSREQRIIIDHLSHSAAKLWNVANYAFKNDQSDLYRLKHNLKDNFWYKNLHSQSAQAVIEKLQVAWKNHFKKHTDKPPGFQPKDGHFPVRWKKSGIRIVDGKLRLSLSKQTREYLKDKHGIESRYLWLELPKIPALGAVQEVEIVPKKIYGHWRYFLHIIYRKEKPDQTPGDKVMSIDLGVSNLATVVVEGEKQPYIFDGRALISKLRWFAKKRAHIQSVLSKQGHKHSKKLHKLVVKEHAYVKDYLHKVSRWIVELAKKHGVGRIDIGAMHKGITNMDLGYQNNEKLHRIPFGKLVKMITYKAQERGIKVESVDEAYTSQTCSICGTRDKTSRKHRGLYACKHCGVVLNADVNGARNILFRVVPSPSGDRDSGLGHPRRIRVLQAPTFA